MKETTKFDSIVQELENQLLTDEEQIMLLAGQSNEQGLYSIPPANNCQCNGDNCNCASGNNCQCNGSNNCMCHGTNNCSCNIA